MWLETESELRRLGSALDGALVGAGAALAIDSPPGGRRSALLEATATLARQRAMHLLSAAGGPAPGQTIAELLGMSARPDPEVPEEELRERILTLVLGLSRRSPLALLVDDAHLADEVSQRALAAIALRAKHNPIALVVATDSTAASGGALGDLLAAVESPVICPAPASSVAARSAPVPSAAMEPPSSRPDDILTAAERRVAERAAGGASNREIADELVVTVKTVELHLTVVYRKLGIASRVELSSAVGGGA